MTEDLAQITGMPRFRESLWGEVTYPARARYGPRLQWSVELIAVHAGTVNIDLEDADGSTMPGITLRSGEVAIMKPGCRESYRFDARRPTTHTYCHLAVTALGDRPQIDPPHEFHNCPFSRVLKRTIAPRHVWGCSSLARRG